MEKNINRANLEALINQYGISAEFEQFFGECHIENRYKYTNLLSVEIDQICQKINNGKLRQPDNPTSKKTTLWMKGEFKLFVWVSAFYAFNLRISIKQLKKKDFEFLGTIFLTKSIERMKYQLRNLFHPEKAPRKRWELEEIQLLKHLLQKYQSTQKKPEWKSIAYDIFLKSKGVYFRTFGQCRQMWANHLRQDIKKDKWTEEQDELLLTLAKQKNKKWSKICQEFGGQRSGHMIKNRYLTLMRKKAKNVEQTSKQSQIESNLLIVSEQVCEKEDIGDQLPMLIQGKEMQTQSLQNMSQESQNNTGKQTEQSICVESFFLPRLNEKWYLPLQITEKGKVDFSPLEIAKFFNENRLLEHLGCSHYQQVQEAFQEDLYYTIQTEE